MEDQSIKTKYLEKYKDSDKAFISTNKGIIINDIERAISIIRDEKFYNPKFDANPDALNDIINYNKDDFLLQIYDCYRLGKLQGIKQGLAYNKK